ncbi:hypothetical protein R6Z07F_008111 [Ovis aries]
MVMLGYDGRPTSSPPLMFPLLASRHSLSGRSPPDPHSGARPSSTRPEDAEHAELLCRPKRATAPPPTAQSELSEDTCSLSQATRLPKLGLEGRNEKTDLSQGAEQGSLSLLPDETGMRDTTLPSPRMPAAQLACDVLRLGLLGTVAQHQKTWKIRCNYSKHALAVSSNHETTVEDFRCAWRWLLERSARNRSSSRPVLARKQGICRVVYQLQHCLDTLPYVLKRSHYTHGDLMLNDLRNVPQVPSWAVLELRSDRSSPKPQAPILIIML